MKRNVLLIISITVASMLLFSTCRKDDDGIPGVEAGSGKVTATINGQAWESKDATDGAVFLSTQGTNTLQAFTDDDAYIQLTMIGNLSAGTTLNGTAGLLQALYRPEFMDASNSYFSVAPGGSGEVNISTFSNSKLVATFEFVGILNKADGTTEEVRVTNGKIDLDL